MPIVYKSSKYLFAFLEPKDKLKEIQALSLVEKTITKINFWYWLFRQGETINVRAYLSKGFIANFNFPTPNSAKMLYLVYSEEFSLNDF